MVGVGAGLANGGKIPFVCAARRASSPRARWSRSRPTSPTQRQCQARRPCRAASPMANSGRRIIRSRTWPGCGCLPNLTIIVPSDPWETAQAVKAAAAHRRAGVPAHQPHAGARRCPRRQAPPSRSARPRRCARARRRHHRQRRDGLAGDRGRRATARPRASTRAVVNMSSIAPLDDDAIRAAAEHRRRSSRSKSIRCAAGSAARWPKWWRPSCPCPMRILGFPGLPADRLGRIPARTFRPDRRRHRRRPRAKPLQREAPR